MRHVRRGLRSLLLGAVLCAPAAAHAEAYWGQGSAAAVTGDCDAAIQARQDALSRATVNAYTALAESSYTPMPAGGFSGISCLDNLLNSGISGIFNPPDLSSILSGIEDGICNFATSLVRNAVAPLSTSLSSGLPLGQIVPGVDLGSLDGGFQISPSIGGSSSLVNVSGTSPVVGNLAGYWGGTPSDPASYGSLFGSAGSTSSEMFGN